MNKFKKITSLILCSLLIFGLAGCKFPESSTPLVSREEPHLYYKDISVVVTSVDKKQWFAVTHHYIVDIEVYNEEYNLKTIITEQGSGAFGTPSHWDVNEGDTLTAVMYSWVYDSTKEVIRREIHHLKN